LKLLLQKYADQRLAETEHLKGKFRNDFSLLDKLKEEGQLEEAGHREARKAVAVGEANAVRDLGLAIGRTHKEEEAQLRQDLDKKHIEEQVAFKKAQVELHSRLKSEFLGAEEAAEERRLDLKALEAFAATKKLEQEKRQRATEAEKRSVVRAIDQQLEDKIKDHEELLKRRREAHAAAQGDAAELRRRLADRKRQMAE